MSEQRTTVATLHRALRISLFLSGLLTLLAGVVVLLWPAKSAMFVTALIASYLIVAGIVYLALSVFSRPKGWVRAGHALLGLAYVAAGVLAYAYLPQTTVTLTGVCVFALGIAWILDGLVSLSLLSSDSARVWTWIYALLTVVAGIVVLLFPLAAVAVLWLVIAFSLIAFGVLQVLRALLLGRGEPQPVTLPAGEIVVVEEALR